MWSINTIAEIVAILLHWQAIILISVMAILAVMDRVMAVVLLYILEILNLKLQR